LFKQAFKRLTHGYSATFTACYTPLSKFENFLLRK
jgi:hypothetical protein